MAKDKKIFVCSECGFSQSKWTGRCNECGNWNTFTEETAKTKFALQAVTSKNSSVKLEEIKIEENERINTGINELNIVLGGGLVKGSAVLLGGAPGIGKSTLLLQLAGSADVKSVLYISGEESATQIKLRANRLNINSKNITILTENNLENITSEIQKIKPSIVIVDSLQTIICSEAGLIPGTVNQIKYCTYDIISTCKELKISMFFIAHITKEGVIAGPKIIEHLVDSVLYFEDATNDLRIIRCEKNRFGSTMEIGLFLMEENGLQEIIDPSKLFTVKREDKMPSGIACAMIFEGSRVLPVEIQALVPHAQSSISRVFSDKIDSKRVSKIAAVLEKHTKLKFSERDIYVNVAGGIKLNEQGIDLPLAFALYSSMTGLSISADIAFAGEISLAGEIRPIQAIEKRAKAADKSGYKKFVTPAILLRSEKLTSNCIAVKNIEEAIKAIF